MTSPNLILLYVADVSRSVAFYGDLFALQPVEQSPNFAMFILDGGMPLGLWAAHDVKPTPVAPAGGVELGIRLADGAAVEAAHADWSRRKIAIIQPVVDLDFGRTFTAEDPDGHRLRVFAPAAE